MNHVDLQVADGIATLILRRPTRANAFDLVLAGEFRDAVGRACADDGARAIVIVAEGEHFCAGGDVDAMAREDPAWAGQVAEMVHEAILRLHTVDRVVVVGARGAVAGAGLSLSLVADMVVSAPSTRFMAAWGTIGLTPDGGATWLLPRVVGNRQAAAMILTGREVCGADSVAWGLATEMVDDGDVEHRARELAIAAVSVNAEVAGRSRQLLQTSWDYDLSSRLDQELAAVSAARRGNQTALQQFLRRRRRKST